MTISCIDRASRPILAEPSGAKTEACGASGSPLAVAELVAGEHVRSQGQPHRVAVERVLAKPPAAVVDDLVPGHGQLAEAVGLPALQADATAEEGPVVLRVRADQVLRDRDLVGDDRQALVRGEREQDAGAAV